MPLHNPWFKLQSKVDKRSQTSHFVLRKRGEVFQRGQEAAISAAGGRDGVFLMKEAGSGVYFSALASHFTAEVFKNH